jgi:Polyribonucleotide nucleotidyltransferase (polynucleotide phosphorylase)
MEIAGRTLTLEAGRFAEQANGAVVVRYGDTMLLATAVASKEPRADADFFPLTVDYEEKMYAAGKIPGSFFKREGKPTDSAILTARLTDRPLRPLFPEGYRNEVQIIVTTFSIAPGERSSAAVDYRCFGSAGNLRYSVSRTGRCSAGWVHRWEVADQP